MPAPKRDTGNVDIYASLALINRAFDQILGEFDQIRQDRLFRKSKLMRRVDLAIRENRAWALFEILEVVHEEEQAQWTRLGQQRKKRDSPST